MLDDQLDPEEDRPCSCRRCELSRTARALEYRNWCLTRALDSKGRSIYLVSVNIAFVNKKSCLAILHDGFPF